MIFPSRPHLSIILQPIRQYVTIMLLLLIKTFSVFAPTALPINHRDLTMALAYLPPAHLTIAHLTLWICGLPPAPHTSNAPHKSSCASDALHIEYTFPLKAFPQGDVFKFMLYFNSISHYVKKHRRSAGERPNTSKAPIYYDAHSMGGFVSAQGKNSMTRSDAT